MTLWEFALRYDDGVSLDNTVLAEGRDEGAAALSAGVAVKSRPGLVLIRPGQILPADVEARWREVCENSGFPELVSTGGRFAIYARTGSPISK